MPHEAGQLAIYVNLRGLSHRTFKSPRRSSSATVESPSMKQGDEHPHRHRLDCDAVPVVDKVALREAGRSLP
jgi:hypothetical protein